MQSIVHVTLVVEDYDQAIEFYTNILGFEVLEDTYVPEQDKRWVLVAPRNSKGTTLLLARAANENQARYVGNQSGGRVFLFLSTDNFWRDYNRLREHEVKIIREPAEYEYGTAAVFEDLYGNLWDLIEHRSGHPYSLRGNV